MRTPCAAGTDTFVPSSERLAAIEFPQQDRASHSFYAPGVEGRVLRPKAMKLRIAWVIILFSILAEAQTSRRLWVLEQPDRIVEYDPLSFVQRSSHAVSREVFQSPQDLQINHAGQMLFLPSLVRESDGFVHPSDSRTVWSWDGNLARPVERSLTKKATPKGGYVLVESAAPRCALSSEGAHLFWFDNSMKTLQKGDRSIEISNDTTFRAWQTDLMGMNSQELVSHAFGACKCETGVCSETCPEASFWWPDEGIGNFFVMTQWVPGQVGSDYQATFLYREAGGGWSSTKLTHAIEEVLDFGLDDSEPVLLEAVRDAGCCGWVNDSDDQVLLNKGQRSIAVFDEWKQYQNRDYDISFYASMAKLSPNQHFVAMTVEATQKAGDEIRLADQGKENPAELAQIQKTLPEMPKVQIVETEEPVKSIDVIPRATLVGWLNDREVLIIEDGLLVSFNIADHSRRNSQIKVAKQEYAFVR
jgi:hypothetical protein